MTEPKDTPPRVNADIAENNLILMTPEQIYRYLESVGRTKRKGYGENKTK